MQVERFVGPHCVTLTVAALVCAALPSAAHAADSEESPNLDARVPGTFSLGVQGGLVAPIGLSAGARASVVLHPRILLDMGVRTSFAIGINADVSSTAADASCLIFPSDTFFFRSGFSRRRFIGDGESSTDRYDDVTWVSGLGNRWDGYGVPVFLQADWLAFEVPVKTLSHANYANPRAPNVTTYDHARAPLEVRVLNFTMGVRF